MAFNPEKLAAKAKKSSAGAHGMAFNDRFGGVVAEGFAVAPPLDRHNQDELPEHTFASAQIATGRWARNVAGDLYFWKGSHWQIVEESDLASDAYVWLAKHFPNVAGDSKAQLCVRTLKRTPITLPAQQTKRIIVACQDFYLEAVKVNDQFKLVRILPEPAMGYTSCVPVKVGGAVGEEYVPGGIDDAQQLRNFMDVSMPALDVREVVQTYIGYTMIPPSVLNLSTALVMVGSGGDGKGVISNLARRILHPESSMAVDLGAKDGFSFEGIENGISLAVVDELPINEAISSKDIKTAISGDPMSINRKGRKRLSVRPTARFMICGNGLPRFDHGGAAALRRRFLFVPFPAQLEAHQRAANLEDRIVEDEARAFFDWALVGTLRIAKERCFDFESLPAVCRRMSGDTMEASDATLAFIKEFGVARDFQATMLKDDLYANYVEWTQAQGHRPLACSNFFARLLVNLRVDSIDAGRETGGKRRRKVFVSYNYGEGLTNAELSKEYEGGHPFHGEA